MFTKMIRMKMIMKTNREMQTTFMKMMHMKITI